MPEDCPCETLWISNPAVLFGTTLTTNHLCESNNINAFTRATLIGLLIAAGLAPVMGLYGLGMVLLGLLFLYGRWIFAKAYPDQRMIVKDMPIKTKEEEGFEAYIRNPSEETAFPNAPKNMLTSPGVAVVTKPTARNPFMNVLLDEIQYNPTRPSADVIDSEENQIALDQYFRVQWNSDPTDVFGRTQSQRQFYTMPSTSIPNDQGSYQNWLYLIPGKTCKEGNRDACIPGTNGGPVTWLSQPN